MTWTGLRTPALRPAKLPMAILYGMLAAVLFEAVRLMESAGAPYIELSGGLRE